MIDLYQSGQGTDIEIDGVVAFDQTALRYLLAVLGSVEVPVLPEPVTEANFLELMRGQWSTQPGTADAAEWRTGRKDFLSPLAQALLNQLETVRSPSTAFALR